MRSVTSKKRDIDKAEKFIVFFASVFNANVGSWNPQSPVLEDCYWGDDKLPEDPVQDLLLQLDAHKTMGPDGIHSWVLKELANVTTELLSIIFQCSWESGDFQE